MDWNLTLEILIKLAVSVVLGSLIGLEREWSKHPAGLRTHVLVSLGSTTFMMIGFYGSEIVSDSANVIDPTRMAAGIVTGIGFLGAGAIMKEGVNVRGLTTAASIWVVAAVGLCIAVELYAAGFLTTFLALVVLVVFSQVELKIGTKEFHAHLLIAGESFKGVPNKVAKVLDKNRVEIESMELKREGGIVTVKYHLNLPTDLTSQGLIDKLSKEKSVDKIEWLK